VCPCFWNRAAQPGGPPQRSPPPGQASISSSVAGVAWRSFARSGRRGFGRGRRRRRIGREIGNLETQERVASRRLRAAILLQRGGLVTLGIVGVAAHLVVARIERSGCNSVESGE